MKKTKKQPLFCTHWSGLPWDNERHHITPWIGLHTLLPFDVFIPNCDCRLFSLVTFYLSYCEKSLKTSSKCACAIFLFLFFPSIWINVSLTFYLYECIGPAHRQTDRQLIAAPLGSAIIIPHCRRAGRCDDDTGSVSGRRPPAELRLVSLTSQRPLLTRRLSGGDDAH